MMRWFVALFMLLPVTEAAAQAFCGDRAEVMESLLKTYSETPVAMGLASSGGVLEILASPDGSWTILITHPSGVACAMAVGKNWEILPQEKGSNL